MRCTSLRALISCRPTGRYARPTTRMLAHMAAVLRLQSSPDGAALDDQAAFNRVLEPWAPPNDVWIRGRRSEAGSAWPPSEFGPARLRVAMFDPFDAPSGCRLPEVRRRGGSPSVIHANCNQGLAKLRLLFEAGHLYVAPWGDAAVLRAAAWVGAVILCIVSAIRWGSARFTFFLLPMGGCSSNKCPPFRPHDAIRRNWIARMCTCPWHSVSVQDSE